MQHQFDKYEVTDSGEMLHIFSLRMLMAEKKIINEDVETVAEACKTYIDDLLTVPIRLTQTTATSGTEIHCSWWESPKSPSGDFIGGCRVFAA